jgi:ribosomal protein S6--L-glutamate ligase
MFSGDKNILCAGRMPNERDLAAIQKAFAVVLPQGCSKRLYEMARNQCPHVFPNYDARFSYPGKIGQIKLFRKTGQNHPCTYIFSEVKHFHQQFPNLSANIPFQYPFIFKFDWGGEGETVYRIESLEQLQKILTSASTYESTGQKGFILQEFILQAGRCSLRCVVIGARVFCYWRIQENPCKFKTNLAEGARIQKTVDPTIKIHTETAVRNFIQKTKINLAGFDMIHTSTREESLCLEINYFFGRKGIGGSEAYYKILNREIIQWIKSL